MKTSEVLAKIDTLFSKAVEADDSAEAMRFAQAADNIVHALATLRRTDYDNKSILTD